MDESLNIHEALNHHRSGRLPEAEKIYRQILERQPTNADALHLLGVLTGNADLIRQAIAIAPQVADYHANLGNILRAMGNLPDAIDAYSRSVQLRPDQPELLNNLGNALREARRFAEAINILQQAVRLKPDLPETHYNLALAFSDNRQSDDAIASLTRAIALKPDYAEAHNALGNCRKDAGQPDEAIQSFRRALELNPNFTDAAGNFLFTLHLHPDYDLRMIQSAHQKWAIKPVGPIRPHENDRNPDRPLRIGYVSPDFRDHVVGHNILPLLREHDRARYHITCYANHPTDDHLSRRMRDCVDQWRPIFRASDDQVTTLIAGDQIDILVDLALHTAHNRLPVFARKPAPIQVTFGGYPGGTGLETIDYRMTDAYLDPQENDEFYAEKSLRMPNSFWCYDIEGMSLQNSPPVNPPPAATTGRITFGCLNNSSKINDATIRLWKQVLNSVPDSRLLTMIPPGQHRHRLSSILTNRVDFTTWLPRLQYLALYRDIDLVLDTIPYNGHTTSLDAFWMGVPVITLIGKTAVGRAGWSQLNNLNLPDLAARTPDEFVTIAATLANDLPRLTTLRSTLRDRMKTSPLMNARQFARDIETAYRQMWHPWISR